MPEYSYKAITKNGITVKNKVQAPSKLNLINSLKRNALLPVSIEQVSYNAKRKQRKQKRNVSDIQEIMKNVNTASISRKKARATTTKEKLNLYFAKSEKITSRDLVIFTQNFYLLKKANFNNIHALNTIIESTENISFKGILEDILAGVEARRKYVHNNGILFKYISLHIYKYDKSWRIIRFSYYLIRTSS